MVKSMRKDKFQPRSSSLIDFDEIRAVELSPEGHPLCKISCQFDDVGGLGEHPVCRCHWKDNFGGLCFSK